MNIQEAFTQAKAGKAIGRGAASFPSEAIIYFPDYKLSAAGAADINSPALSLTFFRLRGGFFRVVTDPDTNFALDPYVPSDADILATDWIVFP